jgi:hypothetical protein
LALFTVSLRRLHPNNAKFGTTPSSEQRQTLRALQRRNN